MNLNVNPYQDDTESQSAKGYNQVLYVPGRAVQARELTQSQSFLKNQVKNNFDTIYINGSIIEGCELSVGLSSLKAYITAGKFYYKGAVYYIPPTSVTITGSGIEQIGFKVNETIVTYQDDEALLDPASGYVNYGNSGADRLKVTIELAKDDPEMLQLWTINGSSIIKKPRKPDYSVLDDVLAKRTYDESGNYLVEGMNVFTSSTNFDSVINVNITSGKAYVLGYEVNFNGQKTVKSQTSKNTEQRLNEPKVFSTGTLIYTLNEKYVKQIDAVTAQILVTAEDVVKGVGGGSDSLQNTSIYSIESVTQGGTTYVNGTDYILSNDEISWISANQPVSGTTYQVDYIYFKDLIEGTDFQLVEQTDNEYAIEFIGTGDTPVDGTQTIIDYTFYLARTDILALTKEMPIIYKGESTNWKEEIIPTVPETDLPLARIRMFPNSGASETIVEPYNYKRTTMREIFNIQKRVEDLEDNQAELYLEREIKDDELPTSLKGILVDKFNTFKKADLTSSLYDSAINTVYGELTMPFIDVGIEYNFTNNIYTNLNVSSRNKVQLTKLTDTSIIDISDKTTTESLNPYGILPSSGLVEISPSVDSWYNDNVIYGTDIINKRYTSSSSAAGTEITGEVQSIVSETPITYARSISINVTGSKWIEGNELKIYFNNQELDFTVNGDTVKQNGNILVNSVGAFDIDIVVPDNTRTGNHLIRIVDTQYEIERDTTFESVGFDRTIEKQKNVTKTIYRKPYYPPSAPRTPSNPTPESSTNDTIERDAYIQAKVNQTNAFLADGKYGEDDISYWKENYDIDTTVEAGVTYDDIANGLDKIGWDAQRHYEEWGNVEGLDSPEAYASGQGKAYCNGDPLCQSISITRDVSISAIDVYFFEAPVLSDDTFFLEIGYMTNGYPDATSVFYNQNFTKEDVTVDETGVTPTKLELEEPVFIPRNSEIFITLGSDNINYRVYINEMGEVDVNTGDVVIKNPYLEGQLFSSSNNFTWTASQNRNLAFNLYRGNFETEGSFETENITGLEFSKFLLNASVIVPKLGKVLAYYSTDNGVSWNNFDYNIQIYLGYAASQLKFKFIFKGDAFSSPVLDLNSFQVQIYKYDNSITGEYLTRSVEEVPEFNTVRVIYDYFQPFGVSLVPKVSVDNLLWFPINTTTPDDTRTIDANFIRYFYSQDISGFEKIDVSSTTGTFEIGETLTGGTSAVTAILVDYTSNYMLLESVSGVLTNGETLTGGTSTATTVFGSSQNSITNSTNFKGRLSLDTDNIYNSPVIKNLKWVMKTV